MELNGSVTIPASIEAVWLALNNPETLRRCIPGCEEVRQISPTEMHARVALRMGPVRATFVGKVLLTDVRAPSGCTLNFEGSGGGAGFAKGSSVITLTSVPGGTQLDYTTQASVAGKLGQIGGRLMDASAKQLADRFFSAFKAEVGGEATAEVTSQASTETQTRGAALTAPVVGPASVPTSTSERGSLQTESSRLLWFAAGVVSTAIGVWMGSHWLR
jgi:uncharacterized protein